MATDIVKTIGKRIRAIRLEKSFTQAELAEKAGMNTNYYAKIERGDISPSLGTYEKIIKALKIKSSDIFPF
jgi:transcriptional regulator with XRE-family HTH domain